MAIDVASSLNLRLGPGTGNKVRATLAADEVYVVVKADGDWREIWYDDTSGWLHSAYTKAPPAGTVVRAVLPDMLVVRAGPDPSYQAIGRVYGGSLRAVLEEQSGYSRIDWGGEEGWVASVQLGDANAAPTTATLLPGLSQSSVGFLQWPASTPGIYSYKTLGNQWGTQRMMYGMLRIGRIWERDHPSWPRMGLGDVSLQNGGPMPGHASHQKGVDCDVRLLRDDTVEAYVTTFDAEYSQPRTAALIGLFQEHMPIVYVFFNDSSVPGVTNWPNHDNHFHVRTTE